jgi:hypothetical protein
MAAANPHAVARPPVVLRPFGGGRWLTLSFEGGWGRPKISVNAFQGAQLQMNHNPPQLRADSDESQCNHLHEALYIAPKLTCRQ